MIKFFKRFKRALSSFVLSHEFFSELLDSWAIGELEKSRQIEIKEYQLRQLRRVLLYAYFHVPYWEHLFESLNLSRRELEILSWKDFENLPILKKETFRDRQEEFYIRNSDKIKYEIDATSGSTGKPISITLDSGSIKRRHIVRGHFMNLCGLKNISQFGNLWRMAATKNLGVLLDFKACMRDPYYFLKELRSKNIQSIGGTLSNLVILADGIKQTGEKANLECIFSNGEQLSLAHRDYLEQFFLAPVYDMYGCVEFGVLGCECKEKNGFHVNIASIYLEIVDEDGRSVKSGEQGRVVVTSFDNKIMPLIRYEIGDLGKWLEGECSCGLTTPRFTLEGRTLHFLHLPDGRKFPVVDVLRLLGFHYQKYAKQVQVVQEKVDRILVRIVPTDLGDPRRDHMVIAAILELLHCDQPIDISIECIESLPVLPNGKIPVFITKLDYVT